MTRQSRLKAWDDAWDRTAAVTHIGSQEEPDENRKRIRELMGQMYHLALPIEAIYKIADAVECAWQIGRSDAAATNQGTAGAGCPAPE